MKSNTVQNLAAELTPSLRQFLYITAAITGGAIMVIEILGAKMLAPYVGTSHFVWTAQIAVTLVALAVGYYFGGRMVDQTPKLSRMYGCILGAALYLTAAVLCVRPIAYACLTFRLALGSLLASTALFFIPLALLAMVGPFFIRILTATMAEVGATMGRLTAVSTFGSFAGTILIGYVLIPFLPNSITMGLTSLLLVLLVAVYFVRWGRGGGSKLLLVAGILLQPALLAAVVARERAPQFAEAREIYRANSNFGLVQVMENQAGNRRFYLNDYLIQNIYDPKERKSLALFTYALHGLARAYTPHLERALCIGLGVGIVPSQLAREGVQVDVVEINPAVVPVAVELFDCETNRLHLTIGDGRYYLNRATNHYDTVIIDAFLGDSSPSHLMTKQAFQSVKSLLTPTGTLVMNTFGEFQAGKDFMMASLEKTLQTVFPSVRIHASGNGNVFFVASPRAMLTLVPPSDFDYVPTACRQDVMAAFNGIVHAELADGIVLSDDYNPVEFYDAATREEHRRRLALHMRSM